VGRSGASTGTGAMRDRCHITKLNEIYRHPGAAVRLQKYRPCCYNLGLLRPTMQTSRTTDGNQQRRNNE